MADDAHGQGADLQILAGAERTIPRRGVIQREVARRAFASARPAHDPAGKPGEVAQQRQPVVNAQVGDIAAR
jgi:hypothetical protein